MAYITNKKRNSLVKSINGSYTFRKILIFIIVILTLGFIAITIVSFYQWLKTGSDFMQNYPGGDDPQKAMLDMLKAQTEQSWSWFAIAKEEETSLTFTLAPLGWGMVVWAIVIVLGSILAVILSFTMKSPQAVRKDVKTLESAAISGKKLTSKDISTHIMKERTTAVKKHKK